MLPRGTDTTVRQQEAEIREGPWTLQKTRGHQPDAMEMVRDLQARIVVKKEAMEEEQHEHARRHAQLQSVVEAKIQEAAELRGRLDDIALAFECTLCFEKLGAGSVSFGCGHTYCNRQDGVPRVSAAHRSARAALWGACQSVRASAPRRLTLLCRARVGRGKGGGRTELRPALRAEWRAELKRRWLGR